MKKCPFCNKPILSDYAYRVLKIFYDNDKHTALQVAETCDISLNQAENYLLHLYQCNMLERIREGKHFYYFMPNRSLK